MSLGKINIRVRYSETDQMGYVYYGVYAQYFEVARVEFLKELGIIYKDLESNGIALPVVSYSIQYKHPAYYDENLQIQTKISEVKKYKISFKYKTYNEKNILLNIAETSLVFINMKTRKPCVPPDIILKKIYRK